MLACRKENCTVQNATIDWFLHVLLLHAVMVISTTFRIHDGFTEVPRVKKIREGNLND